MKKNLFKNIFTTALFVCVLFSSCNESKFLDLDNPNNFTGDKFWKTKEDVEAALGAAYFPIRRHMYGYFGAFTGWLSLNGRGDDIFTILNEDVNAWGISTFQNVASTGNNDFGRLYQGIQSANVVLYNLDKVPASAISEEEKSMIRAEALFLRAYQYFLIVNNYQYAPLRILPSEQDELMKKAASEEELWNQVESDLKEAAQCNLPIRRAPEQSGRIEKGAVLAVLGKAYITQGKFDEGKKVLAELMTAPYSYRLIDNYEDNFTPAKEFNEESIYEINYAELGYGTWQDANSTLGMVLPQFLGSVGTGGWFKLMPSAYLVSKYIEELRPDDADTKFDKRMYANMFFNPQDYGDVVPEQKWYGGVHNMESLWKSNADKMAAGAPLFPEINGVKGRFLLKKYTNHFMDDGAADGMQVSNPWGNNMRVIRYAEVLLLHAEACLRGADVDLLAAQNDINAIRQRAGLPEKTFASADEAMKELQHQCLLEFFGEGHRFDDLKRWTGRDAVKMREILIENGKQGGENFQKKHFYYPIPTSQLTSSNAMEQHPDWR